MKYEVYVYEEQMRPGYYLEPTKLYPYRIFIRHYTPDEAEIVMRTLAGQQAEWKRCFHASYLSGRGHQRDCTMGRACTICGGEGGFLVFRDGYDG